MQRTLWIAIGLIAIAAVVGAWLYVGRDAPAPAVATSAVTPTIDCVADLQCAAKRSALMASTQCRPGIEDLAGYGVRWPAPANEQPQFQRFGWHDQAKGSITYVGDRAEFETASGATQPVTYECDFDPASGKSLAVRVRQGRLP